MKKKIINNYLNDSYTKEFIKHNIQIFEKYKKSNLNKKILVELNDAHSNHLAYSYLANVLSKQYDAEICGYSVIQAVSLKDKIRWNVLKFLSLKTFAIYRSFGVSNFITPGLGILGKISAWKIYKRIYKKIKEKRDIEKICIKEICIGDLIYDSYLRKYSYPTIEINDIKFKKFLLNSVELFVYWNNYFSKYDVAAIMVSHCSYVNAIPLRIALALNIPGYQVTAKDLYYLDNKNPLAYIEFLYYKEEFSKLGQLEKGSACEQARLRMDRRLNGEIGVDLAYSRKSAYGENKNERIILPTPRVKVLIATHCFFDSPHGYGGNIFPDLYEWLDFLGQITLLTDYDWYIKTHPDYFPGTMEVLDLLIKKYPKIVLIPADSSHRQIIAEGINFALTVYGTIGVEYAAMNVPVINASVLNPHINYNFNLHPKTLNEYKNILLNLDKVNYKIDMEEVYEFYYMKNIYHSGSWLLSEYENFIEKIGGYSRQFTSEIYSEWLNRFNIEDHNKILNNIENFISLRKYKM